MKKLIVISLTSTLFFASIIHGAAAERPVTKHHNGVSEHLRNFHAFEPPYTSPDENAPLYDGALGSGLVGH